MEEQIYSMVELLLGSQADRETAVRTLCRAAETALAARLKPGLTPEDCADSFVCAAAWFVLGALEHGGSAADIASFTAGEVTVTKGSRQTLTYLRQQAETLLGPYFGADDFSFQGVRG